MNGVALERVFRAASGRIIAALAARFRDLARAEDAFSESCLRAVRTWPAAGVPDDPAAWLYRVAERVVLDSIRRDRKQQPVTEEASLDPSPEELLLNDACILPDERLRLIFICCHPAVATEARAALTLKLVCGLSVTEIARAFLLQEATLAQRLVRAKRKIADAGVPFELPSPEAWPERLDAVLSTLEIAYARAHEDAAGSGAHAGFAAEVLHLTKILTHLIPDDAAVAALAAQVRYAEARRPARLDAEGFLVPLSAQDPALWRRDLIDDANRLLADAIRIAPSEPRTLQAQLQQVWCARHSLADPPLGSRCCVSMTGFCSPETIRSSASTGPSRLQRSKARMLRSSNCRVSIFRAWRSFCPIMPCARTCCGAPAASPRQPPPMPGHCSSILRQPSGDGWNASWLSCRDPKIRPPAARSTRRRHRSAIAQWADRFTCVPDRHRTGQPRPARVHLCSDALTGGGE